MLAFSLLGIGGTQALSEAFAAEAGKAGSDGQAPARATIADASADAAGNASAATAGASEAPDGAADAAAGQPDADAGAAAAQPDAGAAADDAAGAPVTISGKAARAAGEASADPQALNAPDAAAEPQAQEATPAFRVPEERYVFEYVYGVVADDHAFFSNEPFDYSISKPSVLVSQAAGLVLDAGMNVIAPDAGDAIAKKAPIVFERDGKYGLWDLAAGKVLVDARYDIAGGKGPGAQRGFIELGAKSGDTYPNAKAVVCDGAKVVLEAPLPDYRGNGSIYYFDSVQADGSRWEISWEDASGYRSLSYAEGADGFKPAFAPGNTEITADGRTVAFESTGSGISFRVRGADGTWGAPATLKTDAEDAYDCGVVSNIIEVRGSNDFDYQYFTLDGTLLQNLNDQALEPLGNYVAYERPAADGVVYVFLDTSGANLDAREFPCVQGKITEPRSEGPGGGAAVGATFQCLTAGKLQVYDADLKLVRELAASNSPFPDSPDARWELEDLLGDISILTVERPDGPSSSTVYRGSAAVDPKDLGLPSGTVSFKGTCNGYICLLGDIGEDYNDRTLRIFDKNLNPYKTIDLSSYEPTGFVLESLDLGSNYGYPVLDLRWGNDAGEPRFTDLVLTKSFDPTPYSSMSGGHGSLLIAEKDGKYGFVDADLKPQGDFVYDDIDTWSVADHYLVEKGGKQQLLNADLKNATSGSFDSIQKLAPPETLMGSHPAAYLVTDNGTARVLDRQFRPIDLMGYRPIVLTDFGATYPTARVLPNGNTLVWATDAQGKVGAVDSAGHVLVPFAYEDFAECADASGDSAYVLLRDAKGWFFVSVADIQGTTTNPECDAKGHDYETVTHPPTCEENGYAQQVCKRCGHGQRVEGSDVPKLGHDFKLTSAATEPTCTEEGKGAAYTCSRCQKVKQDEGKPALGHVGFEWAVTKQPTCTEAGLEERSCSRCGAHEQQELAALGHAWSAPEWEWADDFSSAVACSWCGRCGEEQVVEAAMTHEPVEGGMRHAARVELAGQAYRDGRLALRWTGADGVARSLVVRGEPVVDGFSVDPAGLTLPAGATIELDVTAVSEGGVFDALVAKMGSGWPGGTFDVRLVVNGEELHDRFGTLALSFPAGGGSASKPATIYHCHRNDVGNITAHDVMVSPQGIATLMGITDLSTFALEVREPAAAVGGARSAAPLARTGDEVPAAIGGATGAATLALAVAGLAGFVLWRRRAGE